MDTPLPLPLPMPSLSGTATLPAPGTRVPPHEARRVAEDFEAVFLAQFAETMLSKVESDGLFGGGPAEDLYKSLLAQEYGKTFARAGGFGIADAVYLEILKAQEVA